MNGERCRRGEAVSPKGESLSKSLKVLLVEDSEDDRDLVLMRLRAAGFEAAWRQVSSAAMLRTALADPWDLILCDYHMPGFEAPEALAIIKGEAQLDTPVIIVSGILGEEAAVVAMKAGAHDFFSKNKLTRLGAAVERELGEAENRKARRRAEADKERLLHDLQLALQVRDEFLVIASHELRTPLTSLRLQVDSLARAHAAVRARGVPDPIDPRKIVRLDSQLERLSTMVERLLDVTTLSSEPLRLLPAQIDLRQLIADIIERSRDVLDDSGCPVLLQWTGAGLVGSGAAGHRGDEPPVQRHQVRRPKTGDPVGLAEQRPDVSVHPGSRPGDVPRRARADLPEVFARRPEGELRRLRPGPVDRRPAGSRARRHGRGQQQQGGRRHLHRRPAHHRQSPRRLTRPLPRRGAALFCL
jgi:signal transduction histidine kinase